MSVRAVFSYIGENYLRASVAALFLLFTLPILGYKYNDVFSQDLSVYQITLFVLISNLLGVYIGEVISFFVYQYIKRRYFKDAEKFIAFPPWKAWNDITLKQYKQDILSRIYFIVLLLLTAIFYIYYTYFKSRDFFIAIDLGDSEIELKEFVVIYLLISLLLLFPIVSLIRLKKGRFFVKEMEEDDGHKSNLFNSIIIKHTDDLNTIKDKLHNYLINYKPCKKEDQIVSYLKMVAIMRTNDASFLWIERFKKLIKMKDGPLVKTLGGQIHELDEYKFWRQMGMFEEQSMLASSQLLGGNFSTAKLQFTETMEMFLMFLSSTDR